MLNTYCKYGEVNELNIHEELWFKDSLTIKLNSFSHKHAYTGGPTKAMADVSLSKGDAYEDITLSVHGVDGKSESEDGLSDAARYSSVVWHEYKFQLVDFNYDKSIKIIVYKTE